MWIPKDHHRGINYYAGMMTFNHSDADHEKATQFSVDDALRLTFYAAVTAIFLMVIALIVKLMWNWDCEDEEEDETPSENSRLLPAKEEEDIVFSFRSEGDLESGKISYCTSSSEDLCDGTICVICYDNQRNCIFVPCGHCVTCYTCTERIISEKIKMCPICRTPLKKVKMLQIF